MFCFIALGKCLFVAGLCSGCGKCGCVSGSRSPLVWSGLLLPRECYSSWASHRHRRLTAKRRNGFDSIAIYFLFMIPGWIAARLHHQIHTWQIFKWEELKGCPQHPTHTHTHTHTSIQASQSTLHLQRRQMTGIKSVFCSITSFNVLQFRYTTYSV